MSLTLRIARYGLLGFTGGALLTVGAGLTCAVWDWQHRNHIAAKRGKALHRITH